MLKRILLTLGVCAAILSCEVINAAEFTCTNGEIIKGEPITFKEDGVVFRKESGDGYTDKIQWPRFTQETLKKLADYNNDAKFFAEPFIEVPLDLKAKEVAPPPRINVRDVERLPSYSPKPGFLSAWLSPAGLLILISLYIGNLVAGYCIARYRRKQPALVCGVSAVLPVVGPLVFVLQPEQVVEEEPEPEPPTEEQIRMADTNISTGASNVTKTMTRAATVKDSKAAGMEPAVYKKGDITFNRRFFESKFPTFFRPVLGAKEKSVMFVIVAGDKTYEAMRFSRVSTNEIFIVPLNGGGETSISISSIESVEVKPRE